MVVFFRSEPCISVIMAAHNAAATLVEALDSLTGQTVDNFVVHIVDDGSTDETWALLQKYAATDTRFRIYRNATSQGLAASLNLCLEHVHTPYVARMDADAIALPRRFEVQLAFMEKHPEVDVCGTWVNFFGERNGLYTTPIGHDAIAAKLVFGNPMAHPTIMLRTPVLRAVQYDPTYLRAQDYELWSRMIFDHHLQFANIPESLLLYRTHASDFFRPWHAQVLRLNLERMGLKPTDDELTLHVFLSLQLRAEMQKKYTISHVALWLNKLFSVVKLFERVSSTFVASDMQNLFLFSIYGNTKTVLSAVMSIQFVKEKKSLFYCRCLKQYFKKILLHKT